MFAEHEKKIRIVTQSISGLYKNILLKLKALYQEEEARAIVDRLFEHYFGLSPVQRVLRSAETPEKSKTVQIEAASESLLNHVPLQYLLGKAYFMDMEFVVNPSVLIPRPETEELVSLILKKEKTESREQNLRILDIGTGSGCIAVSLKINLPDSRVTAIDVSTEALNTAAVNASNNKAQVHFQNVNILDPGQWDVLSECDLIVSNPPYVTNKEKKLMLPNVLNHEPHMALFVPDNDPLLFYRNILDFAVAKLSSNGSIWFEINEMFGQELHDLVLNQGFKDLIIISDIHKKERFLHARK